eukprot:jgi/Chlat1/2725/Chrsp182S02895
MGLGVCLKRSDSQWRQEFDHGPVQQPRFKGTCRVQKKYTFRKEVLVDVQPLTELLTALKIEGGEGLFTLQLNGAKLSVTGQCSFTITIADVAWKFHTTTPHQRDEWLQGFRAVKGLRRRVNDYYLVGSRLGRGSVSSVQKCVCRLTHVKLAMKKAVNDTESMQGRLFNELQVLVHANKERHPNVLYLEDWFYDHAGDIVLVTELLGGGQLFDRIVREKFLVETEAQAVAAGIVAGLCHLHAHGIAHRDLKPENLMFAESNDQGSNIKIADFDLGKFFVGRMSSRTPCGTIAYNAPELIRKEEYSQAVDMWAFGCVLYLMLSGKPAFHGKNDAERAQNIVSSRVEFPHLDWLGVSSDARDLITGLLDPNPKARLTVWEVARHPWLRKVSHLLNLIPPIITAEASSPTMSAQDSGERLSVPMMSSSWVKQSLALGSSFKFNTNSHKSTPRSLSLPAPPARKPLLSLRTVSDVQARLAAVQESAERQQQINDEQANAASVSNRQHHTDDWARKVDVGKAVVFDSDEILRDEQSFNLLATPEPRLRTHAVFSDHETDSSAGTPNWKVRIDRL